MLEAAAGGTLFLDELGALPFPVQSMFLTFLETGEFNRLGSTSVRKADVRVIATTNRNLGGVVGEGVFREDLIARFPFRYEVPPLRERRREIKGIADRFLWKAREETGAPWRLTETALDRLQGHAWPGNVRELLNVLAYCRLFAKNGFIHLDLVVEALRNRRIGTKQSRDDEMAEHSRPKNDEEKMRELAAALKATDGNRSEAARLLGIDRTTVRRWLKRYGRGRPE